MSSKKCNSKTFPCKAGERCPEHKHLLSTFSTKERVTSLLAKGSVNKIKLVPILKLGSRDDQNLISSLEAAYPENLKVFIQQEKIAFTITKFQVKDKEKWTEDDEVSVLCSLVAYTNSNIYSYGSSAPFSERAYFIAGFEANPFHKKSMKNELSSLSEKEIKRINRGWAKEAGAHPDDPGNPINQMRKLKRFPYVKVRGGFRLTDYANVPYSEYSKIFKAEKQRMKIYLDKSGRKTIPINSLV